MFKILLICIFICINLYGACGCRDFGTANILSIQSNNLFKKLDMETANKIENVIKDIVEFHEILEVENKKLLHDIQVVLKQDLELEKEILFNDNIINSVQSILNTKKAEENIKKTMIKDK